jgi:hypothetical protein
MSYLAGGQGPGKRWARAEFLRDVGLSGTSRCLVLLGPDAGDVGTLISYGVPLANICGVDLDPGLVEAAKAKWPGLSAHCGDVLAYVRDRDFIFLDLCGHVSRAMARLVYRALARSSADGICVGFMRGREKVEYKAAARRAPSARIQIRVGYDHIPPPSADVAQATRACQLAMWVNAVAEAFKTTWRVWPTKEVRYCDAVPFSYVELSKFDFRGGMIGKDPDRFEAAPAEFWRSPGVQAIISGGYLGRLADRLTLTVVSQPVDQSAALRAAACHAAYVAGADTAALRYGIVPRKLAAWRAVETRSRREAAVAGRFDDWLAEWEHSLRGGSPYEAPAVQANP